MSAVTYTIKSDGRDMPIKYEVLSISVVNEVNRISYAEIVLVDGDYAIQKYNISDNDFFDPGKRISIRLREEGDVENEKVVFLGIVIAQSLRQDQGNSLLTVEMSDVAIKLTAGKQSDVFEQIKDSELIEQLIFRCGLTPGTITDTKLQHEHIVQYNTTNWDMLLSRADVNGLLVTAVNGEVSAKAPNLTGSAEHEFNMAEDSIYDLDLKLDIRGQYDSVRTTTWDETNHTLAKSKAPSFNLEQGSLKADKIKRVLDEKGDQLLAPIPMKPEEAAAWGEARMLRSRLSMLRGSFKIPGFTELNLLDSMTLKGMGLKFEGTTVVTGIRHEVVGGDWFTYLQFGMGPELLSETTPLTSLPASGLLPGINGLQTAIVEDIELDVTKRARVKVRMPGITGVDKVVWARMASLDAGKDHGMFFWPEKDDEVVLGFINDDPRYPIILGSVYGTKNVPPVARDKTNSAKGFVSKKGLKLIFDDEEQQISILTSAGNRIVINEKKKLIEIIDLNKNNITLDKGGIMIETPENFIVKAGGNISIKGSSVKIEGSTIELK
jgi:Rhs element Vgr protein